MYKLLIGSVVMCFAVVTAASAEDAKKNTKSLDGTWTVVCFEKNGEAQADAKDMTVKADAGTFTCSGKDGKPSMTIKVVLGQNGTIQATEVSPEKSATKSGVYVLTEGYLAICIHTESKSGEAKPAGSKPHCTMLLKRESAK